MELSGLYKWLSALLLLLVVVMSLWFGMRWLEARGDQQVDSASLSLQNRYQMLREQSGYVGGSWLRTLNPSMQDVQGGLVWSAEQQNGVLHLVNLPDPKRGFRYQLWIHDSRAQDEPPVPALVLEQGIGQQGQFYAFAPKKSVAEPFKFELMLEAIDDLAQKPRVMLMVQP